MASPEGTWIVRDTQSGTPDRVVEIEVVEDTKNRQYRFRVLDEQGNELCVGDIFRQGPTDRFIFRVKKGSSANGPLEFDPKGTNPDTGEDGVWVWQDLSSGQGGHLTER